ncbi:BrnT family toxin [Duganella sp. 1224]|uniref:BrnT family toxin n=1 Tax=Duganella sp. 1224 TaxID=2587052 RepID=UPI0015C9EB4A
MSSSHYTEMTTYTWDEAKRKINLRDHGLDFKDAATVIENNSSLTIEDTRYHYNERRFLTPGFYDSLEVAIVYAERHYGLRIISFRKATRRERLALFRANQ